MLTFWLALTSRSPREMFLVAASVAAQARAWSPAPSQTGSPLFITLRFPTEAFIEEIQVGNQLP